jgi:hypothetical protein
MKIITEISNEDNMKTWKSFLESKKLPTKDKIIGMHWFKPNSTSGKKYYYYKSETQLNPGEQVLIELDTLEPCSIRLINDILYSNKASRKNHGHHVVIVYYNGKKYRFDNLDEWKHSFQDPDDVNRMKTFKHTILQDFEYKTKHNKEKHIQDIAKELYSRYSMFIKTIPSDVDMDIELDTYGKLYHISNSSDPVEKLRNYIQVKWYVEHNIEPDYLPDEDVELSIGNATMLDDFIYKYKLTED